jgi:hypothetical protein
MPFQMTVPVQITMPFQITVPFQFQPVALYAPLVYLAAHAATDGETFVVDPARGRAPHVVYSASHTSSSSDWLEHVSANEKAE